MSYRKATRETKLLDPLMKIIDEGTITQLTHEKVNLEEMLFSSISRRAITDAIFLMRQQTKKYKAKKNHYSWLLLIRRKLLTRYNAQLIWSSLKKLKVDEWLLKVVQARFNDVK